MIDREKLRQWLISADDMETAICLRKLDYGEFDLSPSEYTVASASFQEGLISEVNRLLAEGWRLYGDLQVTMAYRGTEFEPVVIQYSQAMTRCSKS